MCGIVACQTLAPVADFLLDGLRRLEYRGYDSAGIAARTPCGVTRLRAVGRLSSLTELLEAYDGPPLVGSGIGHTRWATHGVVNRDNSHPHVDCRGGVHVVHNGIIENAPVLRDELALRGHRFATEVDSEVVAHLVEDAMAGGADPVDAVDKATSLLTGSWALAVVTDADQGVVLTANRSPLVVGTGSQGVYAASDLTALAGWAQTFHVVEDGDVVVLSADRRVSWRRADGSDAPPVERAVPVSAGQVERGTAPDFMAKEIGEQAHAISAALDRLADGIADGSVWRDLALPPLHRVRFAACGTSLNAAHVLARLLGLHGVPSCLAPASELDGWVTEPDVLVVALSQSGETADVIRSIDDLHGTAQVLALTNVDTSTLARTSEAVVGLGAGPEIGVAATKTFTAQVVTGAAVLLSGLVYARRLPAARAAHLVERLREVPHQLAAAERLSSQRCAEVARELVDASGFLFVARGAAVPYAAEGALKLKELTYRWGECQPAGELKHGPIALIDEGTPVVVVDDGHPKLPGNVAEMRARRARVLDVGGPGSSLPYRDEPGAELPWGPLASVVVLQHFARDLALALGRDVDKPRNLAKSVTVE